MDRCPTDASGVCQHGHADGQHAVLDVIEHPDGTRDAYWTPPGGGPRVLMTPAVRAQMRRDMELAGARWYRDYDLKWLVPRRLRWKHWRVLYRHGDIGLAHLLARILWP